MRDRIIPPTTQVLESGSHTLCRLHRARHYEDAGAGDGSTWTHAKAVELAEEGDRGLLEREDDPGHFKGPQFLLEQRRPVLELANPQSVGPRGGPLDHIGEPKAGLEGAVVFEAVSHGDHASLLEASEEPLPHDALVVMPRLHADRRGIDPDDHAVQRRPQEVDQRLAWLAHPVLNKPMTWSAGPGASAWRCGSFGPLGARGFCGPAASWPGVQCRHAVAGVLSH